MESYYAYYGFLTEELSKDDAPARLMYANQYSFFRYEAERDLIVSETLIYPILNI